MLYFPEEATWHHRKSKGFEASKNWVQTVVTPHSNFVKQLNPRTKLFNLSLNFLI